MADTMPLDRPVSPADRPQPRPVRSPARSAQIRIQNRRRAYLDKNPAYFQSLEHELADPLLYDTLIRRFQSPEDREKDGRKKGWSRVLELDLLRGEAKLSQLNESLSEGQENVSGQQQQQQQLFGQQAHPAAAAATLPDLGEVLQDDVEANKPKSREEGQQKWKDFLQNRFILGHDEDFNYGPVDGNDALDDLERQDEEEAWFGDEEPSWFGEDEEEATAAKDKRRLRGETGLQDF
ncbi:coiled-coil domain-containing protein [Apiospora kogelbergensis]|uniref:coiled-coil domain-containing protein n=1 Tax=Apiospora kogelbergensis TaxID=1337665 RepID=UPI003131C215